MANMFFMFCMTCPLQSEDEVKQPLKLLLWSLICCAIVYLLSVAVVLFSADSSNIMFVSYVVLTYAFYTCMTSSVWLNFYCTQIVPAQKALFIWIKKNIKHIIYCIWIAERISCLSDLSAILVSDLIHRVSDNGTTFHNVTMTHYDTTHLQNITDLSFTVAVAYFLVCSCVMIGSIATTVVYLCRHVRRMAANGCPFTCPIIKNQVRVTVSGVLQGVVYLLCPGLILIKLIYGNFNKSIFISGCFFYTVISFYMFSFTLNLGAAQAVFRQRTINISIRATQ
ncbi:hypothetical protein LDENG_00003100 [Lucifuga dentata]|nr:hypothetical protein LDENG_00003100 [Lucifuga dentata]